MELTNHNARALMASSDLVSQNTRGEHNLGPQGAPQPVVKEAAGDTSKTVASEHTEQNKNDLKDRKKVFRKSQKGESEEDEENNEEKLEPFRVGFNLDINA